MRSERDAKATARARWLASLMLALADAERLLASLSSLSHRVPEIAQLRAQIDAARANIDALQHGRRAEPFGTLWVPVEARRPGPRPDPIP